MSDYYKKLRDPRWQRLRLRAMDRDGFRCQCCGDKESTLNVHHLKYKGDPWDIGVENLETLCEACHKNREGANLKFKSISSYVVVNEISPMFDYGADVISKMASFGYCITEIKKTTDNARKKFLIGLVHQLVKEIADHE